MHHSSFPFARRLKHALSAAALGAASWIAWATPAADESAIRSEILSIWNRPDTPVDIGPVVVVVDHAVADWTQGSRGGRALMARDKSGHWSVAACGGDGLKKAKTLESAGMSATQAQRLSASLARAEAAVAPARQALFSTFDGMMHMDAADPHADHAASGAKP